MLYFLPQHSEMPKVKRSRKPPPDGWELIEPTLDELDQKMREGRPVTLNVIVPTTATRFVRPPGSNRSVQLRVVK